MAAPTSKKIVQITVAMAVILFILSLTQTSYCTGECGLGYLSLLFGWLGVLLEFWENISALLALIKGADFEFNLKTGATFSWLANPLMLFSIVIVRQNKILSLVSSTISTSLILSFLWFDYILNNEAGHYNKITAVGIGHWLWLATSLTLLVGGLVLYNYERTKKPLPNNM